MESIRQYFIRVTPKSVENLVAAFDLIPQDKQTWSPMGDARTAIDQLAEVALLNGNVAKSLQTRDEVQVLDFDAYRREKQELSKDVEGVKALLKQNTDLFLEELEKLPDAELDGSIQMPWGPMTVTQVISYPFWNNCYHEGQINYIASMLGCLP